MTRVTSHQDKGVWRSCSTRKCAQMSDSVSRGVEKVKRTVTEVVKGIEASDLEFAVKANFSQIPISIRELSVIGLQFGSSKQ